METNINLATNHLYDDRMQAAPLGDAKIQADALATEITVLKVGIVTVSVAAAGEGVYIIGHALKAW